MKKDIDFSLEKMMGVLLSSRWFDPADPILHATYEPSESDSRLLVCTGSNATGKSFFGRMVSDYCRSQRGLKGEAECLRVGMELRCASGPHRAFVVSGMEDEESTGVNSVHMLMGVLKSAKSREHANIVVIDEPDIGLSESYSAALGQFISLQLSELSELTKLVVIVSHSRPLIEPLMDFDPGHLRFGDELSLEEWLEYGEPPKTIEDLLNLKSLSRKTFSRIERKLR